MQHIRTTKLKETQKKCCWSSRSEAGNAEETGRRGTSQALTRYAELPQSEPGCSSQLKPEKREAERERGTEEPSAGPVTSLKGL